MLCPDAAVFLEIEVDGMGIFSKASGLDRLAERYPAGHAPAGNDHVKQTVQVGIVRYRRCVTVGIGTEGLFLWVRPPVGRQAKLLIPWNEIRQIQEAKLYGRPGMRLSIGEPEVGEITIYRELFEPMGMYIDGGRK